MKYCYNCEKYENLRLKILLAIDKPISKKTQLTEMLDKVNREILRCKKECQQKSSRSIIIPQIRQWPNGYICEACKKAVSASKKLNLNRLATGPALEFYYKQCNNCIEACEGEVRSCPGAKTVRDLLQKWALQKLPVPKRNNK